MLSVIPFSSRCCVARRFVKVPLNWMLRATHITPTSYTSKETTFRQYSQREQRDSSALTESKPSGEISTSTTFETVKENTKTVWNFGVILLGVGITGSILWAIFRELFSSSSPNNIYSKALDRCIADVRLQDQLGEPIKGYGEETRRGRRRHVSHTVFLKDGINHMLMKFYVQGSRKKGTAFLEMREDGKGNYQYNFFVVQLDDLLRTRIILEDNRHQNTVQPMDFSHVEDLDSLNVQ